MKSKLTLVLPALFAIMCINTVWAQNRISSPYSRFGIGDLFQNTHVNNMAMGGISQAIYSPFFVNPANPASYTAYDTLSFIFDAGLHARFTTLSTTTVSQSANYASVGNLLFGFPITQSLNASFGLVPYSAIGYKMVDHQEDPIYTNYNKVYDGTGGINQFFAGASYDITRNVSLGVNASYMFGTMNHSKASEFDTIAKFNIKETNSTRVHDFMFNYGILYHKQKTNGFQYNAGATFIAQTKLNTTFDNIAYSYTSSSLGVEVVRDSVISRSDGKQSITMPMGFGVGLSMGKLDKWLIGSDFTFKQWEKFKYSEAPDSLQNNMQIALGGFYSPSSSTVSSYWNRITYRAGIRYSNGFLQLRNQRIDEFGISFGIGLPLPRTSSSINLAVEFGSRGTEKENLINENYVKFTLGLSIFERWFVIQKYE